MAESDLGGITLGHTGPEATVTAFEVLCGKAFGSVVAVKRVGVAVAREAVLVPAASITVMATVATTAILRTAPSYSTSAWHLVRRAKDPHHLRPPSLSRLTTDRVSSIDSHRRRYYT